MRNKLLSAIKPIFKTLVITGLVAILALGNASGALAARSGGRIGGGSFRAPSRTYAPPSRTYAPPGGGYYPAPYYPGGGGFGFPFLLPFFGIGGGFGGLFTILIFMSLAGFLVQTLRRVAGGDAGEGAISYGNPKVSVARVQVGLLSQARYLQKELDELALSADTSSANGRAQVLQEASLALLRHPEYWAYGTAQSQQTALEAAEARFNQLALAERSKFTEETLSNVNNQLRQASSKASLSAAGGELANQMPQQPSEYIVATIIVGVEGNLQLPPVNNPDSLRQALRQVGSISSDRLLALEILWAPQADGDSLTADDLLAEYPDLKLI